MSEAERLGMDALVEVHDEAEMDRAGALGLPWSGINNRRPAHLRGRPRLDRMLAGHGADRRPAGRRERHLHPDDVARCAAAGASAMLVGESLMRQADVTAATKILVG
jgi:indole-3-glycerol phosphate synthase